MWRSGPGLLPPVGYARPMTTRLALSPRSASATGSRLDRVGWPLFAAFAALLAIGLGWVGYTASDDASYYDAALRWLSHPPYAGDDHWATRFPLVLTLAGMIALWGKGAAAMAATALL